MQNEYTVENPRKPSYLQVELTNHCSIQCSMCELSHCTREKGYMSEETFKRIVHQLMDWGIPGIRFTLWGEALMHPQVMEFAIYAKQHKLQVGLNTNGILLNETKMNQLIEAGVDEVIFSVDSFDDDHIYKKFRPSEKSIHDVNAVILHFIEMKKQKNSRPPAIHLQMIGTPENESQHAPFLKYWQSRADTCRITHQYALKKLPSQAGVVEEDYFYECKYPWTTMGVYFNGDVTACCRDVNGRLHLGNVHTTHLRDLYLSGFLQTMRRNLSTKNKEGMPEICKQCFKYSTLPQSRLNNSSPNFQQTQKPVLPTKKNQKKIIWHVGAWAGNFGDSVIQRSIAEHVRAVAPYEIEFKYINCQTTEFTDALIAEMNEQADLLLLGGGGLIFFRPQDNSKSGWQFNIDKTLLDKIQIPFVVHGIGYNRFEYDRNDFPSELNEHLRKTVEKATLFSVRNTGTKNELIRRGCDGSKIEVIPDSGMFLEAEPIKIPGLRADKLKIAINWTTDREEQTFPQPWKEQKERFITNLIGLCTYLVKKQNAQIVYVGHMGMDFDREIITRLKVLEEHLLVIDEVLPDLYPGRYEQARKLAGIYQQMDLVLGMRGHANIIAFGQHVPFIPIGSHRKNRYLLEDIGESKYILDVRNNEKCSQEGMIRIVCSLLHERDAYLKRHHAVYQRMEEIFHHVNARIVTLLDKEYEVCPLCGSKPEFYRKTNRYEIYRDVVICKNCELIYLSPLVKNEEHASFYQEAYRKLYQCPRIPDTQFHKERTPASLHRIEFLEKNGDLNKRATILDVGCGGGTFLMHLKEQGYKNIQGVEIEPHYSKYIREKLGIPLFNKPLETMESGMQYDIITLWHALEHVVDLKKSLAAIKRLLKDGGTFFLEVPLIFDPANPPKDTVTFQIAHNYYFTPKSLQRVLRNAGFRITTSEVTPMNFFITRCKKEKKVLVATYLPRHFKKMIPLIKELEKRSDIELKVIVMTDGECDLAEKAGIPYSRYDEYTDKIRRADFDLEWGFEPLIHAIDREQPDLFVAIEVNLILRNAIHYCREHGIKTFIVQHGTPNKYS
ncbi:MAG: polysaccharide pyruvyl transferase family protein, partial [Nitrospirota bacterium]